VSRNSLEKKEKTHTENLKTTRIMYEFLRTQYETHLNRTSDRGLAILTVAGYASHQRVERRLDTYEVFFSFGGEVLKSVAKQTAFSLLAGVFWRVSS